MPLPSPAAAPGTQGELTRRYLVNTAANGLLRAASALAGLWAARALVDSLGATGFGLVALSSSLAGYLAFLGLGLPAGLVRQVADYRGRGLDARLRSLVGITLRLVAGIGLAASLLLVLFALGGGLSLLALPPGAERLARMVMLATAAVVFLSWPLSVFSATLTGLQRFPALNAISGVAALASAGVSVAVARAGGTAAGVVLATGAVMVAAGLAQAALVRRALPASAREERPPGAREEIRPLLAFGVWALALELAALLIYQTDQVLLGVFVSVESLTAYYVVARLHNLIREGNGVLGAALFPLIAEEEGRGNPAAAEQAFYRGTRYCASIVAPATLAALLLAKPFLLVWMGPAFVRLAPLAQAFASYWLVAVLTSTAAQVALGRGESALLGKIALGTAIVNLVVSLALVRPWGIAGVIAGTLVAYALAIPVQLALLFPRLGIARRRFLTEVIRPVYGVLLPAGGLLWLLLRWLPSPTGILALLAEGALVVGSCWIALWFVAVDRRDRRRLGAWLRGEGRATVS